MALGVEQRAQIDTETMKGLLLINGGGAVALLAFLQAIFGKPGLEPLVMAVLWALAAFQLGLVAAVVHNRLRRKCSLVYEQHEFQPPRCTLLPAWVRPGEPCVCFISTSFMWLSIVVFVVGGFLVFYGGLRVANHVEVKQEGACWQVQEVQKKTYKVNQCTGAFERIDLNKTTPKSLNPGAPKSGAPVS